MRKEWTPEEDVILREMYSDLTVFADDIAKKLGRNKESVYYRAKYLKLKRPKDIYKITGKMGAEDPKSLRTRFQKGHIPPNKGKPLSEELKQKLRDSGTQFQPGHAPHNKADIGTERVTKDGYIEVRTEHGWIPKHRLLWEKINGKIPPAHCIWFKDHNRNNITIENLEMISFQEAITRNNINRYPEELIELIKLQKKLQRKLNQYGK